MKKNKHIIFYSVLALALAVTIAYSARQSIRTQQYETALEDIYQSALLEAINQLESLSIKLEKVLISADESNGVMLLTQISRQAGEAQKSLALLPASHETTQQAIRFCTQTSEYAETLTGNLAVNKTLSAQDEEQLASLMSQATLLYNQLYLSSQSMQESNTKFVSSGSLFYENAQSDARPLDQLADKDSAMDYPTLIYDGAFADTQHSGEPKGLPDNQVTQGEALEIAKQFVGADRVTAVQEYIGVEGDIPTWGVQVQTDGCQLDVQVTKQGGQILWMVPEQGNFQTLVSLDECINKAQAFLESRGFKDMESNHYQVYSGVVVINFTATQEGVILYPDQIKVQVRLDTGEVVGWEARSYWINHVKRDEMSPSLTMEQAREKVSSRLDITSSRLCLIPRLNAEVLCYEFVATYGDGDYQVYINANTGEEVEILKIIPVENGIVSA